MTLQEQVNMLLSEKQRKKKFDDVEEQDWRGALEVVKLLIKQLSVKDNTEKIKRNPAQLMFDVLSKKNAEIMTLLDEEDITLAGPKADLLKDYLDKCVKYAGNLNTLKGMANGDDAPVEQTDDDGYDENDFLSPERMAGR